MSEYKTFEELKEELGDEFEDYMYKANIELLNKLQQKENIIKEVREEIKQYKKIMENRIEQGIEQGAYYSYLGSLQQRLDKFLEILDKGE